MSNPLSLKQGLLIGPGRYLLIKELGRGGMGIVWLAQDTQLNEQVALKFLPPEVAADPVALNDLRRETVRSHRLTHPNIIRIHDFNQQTDGLAFISMEYAVGGTLSHWRLQQSKQVLTWEQAAPLARQLCAALDYAHTEGVVHRDLKPANIMMDDKGRLKLTDFGIAAVMSDSMSRVSAPKPSGTLLYMSPQQLMGKRPQVSDDVYALGATLYELLTGKPPFYSGDITHQVLHEPPEPLDERLLNMGVDNPVPPGVAAMVMACLSKDSEQRPQSARAVAEWIGLEIVEPPSVEGLSRSVFTEKKGQVLDDAPNVKGSITSPAVAAAHRLVWAAIGCAAALVLLFTALYSRYGVSVKTPASQKPVAASQRTRVTNRPASWKQLFFDNFDRGNTNGWRLVPGWKVEKDESNFVLSGSGHAAFAEAGNPLWSDYNLKLKVKLIRGSTSVNFRVYPTDDFYFRYWVHVNPSHIALYKAVPYESPTTAFVMTNFVVATGIWHTIEILGVGNHFHVNFDGQDVIDYADEKDPILHGSFSFETMPDSHVFFDDVEVNGKFSETFVSGTIAGDTWTSNRSPYLVTGDIFVAHLEIQPGVEVRFLTNAVFQVDGLLRAEGTLAQPIRFLSPNSAQHWKGIFFNQNAPGSTMTHCTVRGSTNSGIRILNSAPALRHCVIANNSSPQAGGGIYASLGTQTLILDRCTITNNLVVSGNETGGGGGGVFIHGNAQLVGCLISSNTLINPLSFGGGGLACSGGNFTVKNCAFTLNRSSVNGGGVVLGASSLDLANCIISSNTATSGFGNGSGLFVHGGNCFARAINCTIVGNTYEGVAKSPPAGGGIFITNSILFFNNAGGQQLFGEPIIAYSDVQNGATTNGNRNSNPVLKPGTLELLTGSPCIDAGNPDPVYTDTHMPPSKGGARNDMGAYGGSGAGDWLDIVAP